MDYVKRVDQRGIILSIILVTILIINFSSIKENIFFQPSSGTVAAVMLDIKNNPSNYIVVSSDNLDFNQDFLIQNFMHNFSIYNRERISESISYENKIIFGLKNSSDNFPYLNFLSNKQAIVIYNSSQNSLYIYASNLETLNYIIQIISNYESNKLILNYPQIEFVEGYIEELFFEPITISSRVVSPLFLNEESFVEINVQVFRKVDELLLAEMTSLGFNISRKSQGFLLNSTNLVVWHIKDLFPGNYSFNYSFIPSVSNGNIKGKLGVKIGFSEEDYGIIGQSAFSVNSRSNVNKNPSQGSSGLSRTKPINTNFISYSDLINGKLVYLKDYITLELNPGEMYNLSLKDIQKNYASLILNKKEITINSIINQETKLSIFSFNSYDFLTILESINSDNVSLYLKIINEEIPREVFDIELPTSVNPDIFNPTINFFNKILIFSALVLIILIITFFLFKFNISNSNKKDILKKAKQIAIRYKSSGYSENQIKKIFREKGWKEEDINKII